MYKTVRKEIKRLSKKYELPIDYLEEVAENLSINEDGEKSTAQYIINGLEYEVDKYIDFVKDLQEIETK